MLLTENFSTCFYSELRFQPPACSKIVAWRESLIAPFDFTPILYRSMKGGEKSLERKVDWLLDQIGLGQLDADGPGRESGTPNWKLSDRFDAQFCVMCRSLGNQTSLLPGASETSRIPQRLRLHLANRSSLMLADFLLTISHPNATTSEWQFRLCHDETIDGWHIVSIQNPSASALA